VDGVYIALFPLIVTLVSAELDGVSISKPPPVPPAVFCSIVLFVSVTVAVIAFAPLPWTKIPPPAPACGLDPVFAFAALSANVLWSAVKLTAALPQSPQLPM
jgi:hypothetical protein